MIKHTPGPWGWLVEDYSMAILCRNHDPFEGHVMSVSPCLSCQEHAKKHDPEWRWKRCTTPSQENARLIAKAPEMYEVLRVVAERGHLDTCSYSLVRNLDCDCGARNARELLAEIDGD